MHQVQLLAIEDREVEVEQGQDEAAHLEEAHRRRKGDRSAEVLSVAEGSDEDNSSIYRTTSGSGSYQPFSSCQLSGFCK